MRGALKRAPEQLFVAIAGRANSCRRSGVTHGRDGIILRIDHVSGHPVLTLPSRTGLAQGERFLASAPRLAGGAGERHRAHHAAPRRQLFPAAGRALPHPSPRRARAGGAGGERRHPEPRRPGRRRVPAAPRRRLAEAGGASATWRRRRAPCPRHRPHGQAACASPTPRAAGARCSPDGVLTFSWRLVLAPPLVLDYLAAHEVAHLREMNHGPRFWALVERLHPEHRKRATG